jgi:hypothetical protein
MMQRKILAMFVPEVDTPNGGIMPIFGKNVEIDVTERVLGLPLDEIKLLRDNQTETDELVEVERFGHNGPYYVRVEDAIERFFGCRLDNISEAKLLAARAELKNEMCEFEVEVLRLETRVLKIKVTAASEEGARSAALMRGGDLDFHNGAVCGQPSYAVGEVELVSPMPQSGLNQKPGTVKRPRMG